MAIIELNIRKLWDCQFLEIGMTNYTQKKALQSADREG